MFKCRERKFASFFFRMNSDVRKRRPPMSGGKFRKGGFQKSGPKFERKPKAKKWEKEDVSIKEKTACYSMELQADARFADYPLSAQTLRGIRRYLSDSGTRFQKFFCLPIRSKSTIVKIYNCQNLNQNRPNQEVVAGYNFSGIPKLENPETRNPWMNF